MIPTLPPFEGGNSPCCVVVSSIGGIVQLLYKHEKGKKMCENVIFLCPKWRPIPECISLDWFSTGFLQNQPEFKQKPVKSLLFAGKHMVCATLFGQTFTFLQKKCPLCSHYSTLVIIPS